MKMVDQKARRRIDELYELLVELVERQTDDSQGFEKKLYRKYKKLKNRNHKLQMKLINLHCPGCTCEHVEDRGENLASQHPRRSREENVCQ
jgi:hypothetical protein